MPFNNNSRSKLRIARGFALVVTLIMLVLAAVIVIALLSSAALDRVTAKSNDDSYQAELAARNGLEAAKKALIATPDQTTPVCADDGFLVVRVDGIQTNPTSGVKDAYYFLAKAKPRNVATGQSTGLDYYPLFAGGTTQSLATGINPTTYAVTPPTAPAAAFATNPAQEIFGATTRLYPQLFSGQAPAYTQWIEIRDPNDTATAPAHNLPYQRYTFWIEDLAGYLDSSVAGNIADTGNANKRPLVQTLPSSRYQTTPAELALFTIFDPVLQPDSGKTGAKSVIQNRALQFTVPTLKIIASGSGVTDATTPFLATRLEADSELPLVPYGYGYIDEGNVAKPKLDINQQVSTGGGPAVSSIAKKVNDNLPLFGPQRQGGLTALDYVNTIAASLIDYADTDSDGTVGADYRGYDSYPLISEIYTTKNWTKKYQNPAGTGPYYVEVTVDCWVELWNMSNQVTSGTVSLKVTENHPVHVGTTTPYTFGTAPSDLHDNSTVATIYPSGAFPLTVTMQPNEYKVLNVQTDTFQLNSGVSPPDSFPAPSPASQSLQLDLSKTDTRYELTWKSSASAGPGEIVDKSNAGIVRVSGALSGPSGGKSNRNWRGSLPGFIGNNPNGTANYYNTTGDPRLAYYWACPQAPNGYADNSSMWSRNTRMGIGATFPANSPNYKEVAITSWPDRGHNSPLITTAPGTATKDPPAASPVLTEPTKAPGTISNSGSYSTTAEMANLYDPAQWNITPDANNRWTDIVNGTAADGNYGGGMTLRIGRPEFTQFDQPGVRAWQLLDLFHTGNRLNTRGLVNVNTASRDVLRALGAGILLNRDVDMSFAPNPAPPSGFYPPFASKQADIFADAVIAARPFLSASQLSTIKIAGTSTPLFGNSSAWTAAPPSEWNDSGTEEYFAKILALSTVRSRNFRVFVTGQALDKSGRVLSTVSKVIQIYLHPTRDGAGKITAQKAELTYETEVSL